MKIKHLVILAGLTGAAYAIYHNRDKIKNETEKTLETLKDFNTNLNNIKNNLSIIEHEKEHLQDISQSLAYKLKAFNHEVEARISQMPLINKEP